MAKLYQHVASAFEGVLKDYYPDAPPAKLVDAAWSAAIDADDALSADGERDTGTTSTRGPQPQADF